MNRLHHFKQEEADEILESAFEELKPLLTQAITKALENRLDEFLATSPLISLDALKRAGMPQVLLRVRTLQTLLDVMREQIQFNYSENLRNAGKLVGFTFGIDVIGLLEQKRRIPIDYNALLRFWSLYDSSAGMGTLSFLIREGRLSINIQENFLTLDYDSNRHRHCSFWEGYLQAVLDTLICMWLRWIEEVGSYRIPSERWVVVDVREVTQDMTCSFDVTLVKEIQTKPRDLLVNAMRQIYQKNFAGAVQTGRIALELSAKELIGLPEDFKVSFGRLLTVYQNSGLSLSYKNWEKTYGLASEPMHRRVSYDERQAVRILQAVQELLIEANIIRPSDEQREDILNRKPEYSLLPPKRTSS